MRHLAATVLTAAVLALSGCGEKDVCCAKSDADPTGDATTSAEPTEPPPPPMATGPTVTLKSVTYRLPEGWDKPDYSYGGLTVSSHDADSNQTIMGVFFDDIVTDDAPIDEFARLAMETSVYPNPMRMSNIVVDGVEVYRLESTDSSGVSQIRRIEYGTGAGPYITSITIQTSDVTKREERLLHESVLNTIDWQF